MGDAEVFWRTASYNANLAAFSHKFTADIRDAQEAGGRIYRCVAMLGDVSNSVAGWADAGVIIPWTAYLQYGDKQRPRRKTGLRWKMDGPSARAPIPTICG